MQELSKHLREESEHEWRKKDRGEKDLVQDVDS
jgi:hypothetical protein